jgi:hypothetical protein
MDKLEWRPVLGFPDYSVSNHGDVYSNRRQKPLKISFNEQGLPYVAFWVSNKNRTKGLAKLVAEHFLTVPDNPLIFNTPIHLNGNRRDVTVWNLAWRSRPFAMLFHKELEIDPYSDWDRHFEIIETGEMFTHLSQPAMKYGMLQRDIRMSTYNFRKVYPNDYRFRLLD